MKQIIFFIIGVVVFNSCKKDKEVSNAPQIDFVSISPSSPTAFQDEVIITINYKDADGDLGENDADVTNCFVKDSRNDVEYEFRIPQLSPDNSSITITGDLDIRLQSIGISDGQSSETVSFEVYLKDRAGNSSNRITTNTITVQGS